MAERISSFSDRSGVYRGPMIVHLQSADQEQPMSIRRRRIDQRKVRKELKKSVIAEFIEIHNRRPKAKELSERMKSRVRHMEESGRGIRALEQEAAEKLRMENVEKHIEEAEGNPFVHAFKMALLTIIENDRQTENQCASYQESRNPIVGKGQAELEAIEAYTILSSMSPIHKIVDRPLEYLAEPITVISEGEWNEVVRLAKAVSNLTSQALSVDQAMPFARATSELFADAIEGWIFTERFKVSNINELITALARVRDADCKYFEKIFGSVQAPVIINSIATLYEETAKRLKERHGSLATVSMVLENESLMLRLVEAQNYDFIKYDRPVDARAALLHVLYYAVEEIEKAGHGVNYQEIAKNVLGAFRLHRIDLSDENIFAICSFLSGKVLSSEMSNPTMRYRLPWLILDHINNGGSPLSLVKKLRSSAISLEDQLSIKLCTRLAEIDLDATAAAGLVPDLLLHCRKIGYLKEIDYEFYSKLGIDKDTWELHQLELEHTKPPLEMFLKNGDIVCVFTFSGWTITEAHFELVRMARKIAKQLVQGLEIKNGMPIRKRNVVVLLSHGDPSSKQELQMPGPAIRARISAAATLYDEGVYVLPTKYVPASDRSSVRAAAIKQKLKDQFSLQWTEPTAAKNERQSYPTDDSFFILVGSTEKFGPGENGAKKAAHYVRKETKLDELTEFLNETASIHALMEDDIDDADMMTKFVLEMLHNWSAPGCAVELTRHAELHSTLTVDLVEEYVAATQKGESARAKKIRAAFFGAVPPRIQDEAWQMMCQRYLDTQVKLEDKDATKKLLGL